jgi:hypothetical protein
VGDDGRAARGDGAAADGVASDKPVWSVAVLLLAALAVPGRIAFEYARHWNGLASFYLPHYVSSGALGLRWQRVEVDSAKLHEFLRSEVYGARPADELAQADVESVLPGRFGGLHDEAAR